MKLLRINIEKLFGQFDYDIALNQDEGITILTGPNGYGKTTILNIIWNLFNQDFGHIHSVPFKEINLNLDNSQTIRATKKNGHVIKAEQDGAIQAIHSNRGQPAGVTGLYFELIAEDAVCETFEFPGEKSAEDQRQILKLLKSIKVYLIKDQRLTYSIAAKHDGTFKHNGKVKRNGAAVLNRIELFSKDLAERISQIKSKEDKLALDLADTFPARLLKYSQPLPQDVFDERFKRLSEKQRRLQIYGMSPGVFEKSEYEGENQRILSVYLEDYERKTALYDELLIKIDLFFSILNKKELVNKTIAINAGEGLCFKTTAGIPLELSNLSSGEQHEVILLYELLFNAPPDSLVLIDEPETSMHVAWQIEFLHDIEKIAKLSRLSFIIASHAPDLINDKIDLCVDLFKSTRRKEPHE
jgi:ABC-type cobalamin/Fe3+-siderophores transport system ATPase subunit